MCVYVYVYIYIYTYTYIHIHVPASSTTFSRNRRNATSCAREKGYGTGDRLQNRIRSHGTSNICTCRRVISMLRLASSVLVDCTVGGLWWCPPMPRKFQIMRGNTYSSSCIDYGLTLTTRQGTEFLVSTPGAC